MLNERSPVATSVCHRARLLFDANQKNGLHRPLIREKNDFSFFYGEGETPQKLFALHNASNFNFPPNGNVNSSPERKNSPEEIDSLYDHAPLKREAQFAVYPLGSGFEKEFLLLETHPHAGLSMERMSLLPGQNPGQQNQNKKSHHATSFLFKFFVLLKKSIHQTTYKYQVFSPSR